MQTSKKFSTIAMLGLVIAIIVLAFNINKTTEQNTISVSGTYETSVFPDEAYVVLKIVTSGSSAGEAQEANTRINDNNINSLKELGLEDKNVETINYNIDKRQYWDEKEQKYIDIGYEAITRIKATTKNVKEAGKIADDVIKNGANGIEGISFGVSKEKESEINTKALELASLKAKEKAQALAKALNVRIVKIKSITPDIYYNPYVSRYNSLSKMAAIETIINPTNVDYSAIVNVVFEIR